MLGHGTAYVDVKAIDPTHYDKNNFDKPTHTQDFYLADNSAATSKHENTLHYANETSSSHARGVYLQVGAFKNRMLAENMKSRIGKMVTSPIKITQMAHHKKLYRVQIGPIKDVATAKHITRKLKAVGLSSHQTSEV